MKTGVIIYSLHLILQFRLLAIIVMPYFMLLTPNSHIPYPISLHALYEPEPVAFRFETPGWYMILILLISILVFVTTWQYLKFKKNKYRRDALQDMENLENTFSLIPKVFVILKKTAIHCFGKEIVGELHGKQWIDFLDSTGKNINMKMYTKEITDALYSEQKIPSETEKIIVSNAKTWIQTHANKF